MRCLTWTNVQVLGSDRARNVSAMPGDPGAYRYLPKPVEHEALLAAVESAMSDRSD